MRGSCCRPRATCGACYNNSKDKKPKSEHNHKKCKCVKPKLYTAPCCKGHPCKRQVQGFITIREPGTAY